MASNEERMAGYIQHLSSIREDNPPYYTFKFQTKTGVINVSSSCLEKYSMLYTFFHRGTAVKIEDIGVGHSRYFINNNTIVKRTYVDFPLKPLGDAHLVHELYDLDDHELVNVRVKVKITGPRQMQYVGEKKVPLLEAIVADSTGLIRFCAWGDFVDMVQENQDVYIASAEIKRYMETPYIQTVENGTEFHEVREPVSPIEVSDDILASMLHRGAKSMLPECDLSV